MIWLQGGRAVVVRFKYSSRLQPKYHTKDSKCHTKAQSLPNLAMCMPLVDQEEVQPVSLPDFKLNDPLSGSFTKGPRPCFSVNVRTTRDVKSTGGEPVEFLADYGDDYLKVLECFGFYR